MKMSDITNEGSKSTISTLKSIGEPVWDATKNLVRKMDPRQLDVPVLNKFYTPTKQAYSKEAGELAKNVAKANADAASRRAVATSNIDIAANNRAAARLAGDKDAAKQATKDIAASKKTLNAPENKPVAAPEYDKTSALKWTLPVGAAERGIASATSTEEHPEGELSLGRGIGSLTRNSIGGAKDFAINTASGLLGTSDKPSAAAQEEPDLEMPKIQKESIADILKLSGQKAITERDNVAGIIKPKEIVALHESKQLDECGMMGGAPSTASLSINATAGSGEEVANMLAAIMNLAGVKPVTGDMLGGQSEPMPMVKAIDIISRDAPDAMNKPEGEHDHEHEEPLSGMEEEYANTPADPTDVPDVDTNQLAYHPNDAEPGDRMDGTMPKGVPTQESLLQAFQAFKNGQ